MKNSMTNNDAKIAFEAVGIMRKFAELKNGVFTNNLEDSEKKVITNLIKEIQAKIAKIKKAQEKQPPRGPSSNTLILADFLIVAVVVLGLVELIVYFQQGRKANEEIE
ncbi:hypothetical protein G9A89_004050 [Geosiphon pyriformis]|nr:hypothetical protein G9A89_004050 [Geosiphon pyriformis]